MAKKKKTLSYRQARMAHLNNYNIAIPNRDARRLALLRMSNTDYRTYTPMAINRQHVTRPMRKIPRTIIKTIRRAKSPTPKLFNAYLPHKLAVKVPRRALLCLKRGIRKQVMFAIGKSGRSGQKKPKFNQHSTYRCT